MADSRVDLSNVEFETSEDVDVIDSFRNMGLKEDLMRGLFSYGTIFSSLLLKCQVSKCYDLGNSRQN